MAGFLVDENLSPLLASYLRRLKYQARAVRELGLKGEPDEAILNFAQSKGWIIVTGDFEFGKFFYDRLGAISIIILKSRSQNVQNMLQILGDLHKRKILEKLPTRNYLVLAGLGALRIRSYIK